MADSPCRVVPILESFVRPTTEERFPPITDVNRTAMQHIHACVALRRSLHVEISSPLEDPRSGSLFYGSQTLLGSRCIIFFFNVMLHMHVYVGTRSRKGRIAVKLYSSRREERSTCHACEESEFIFTRMHVALDQHTLIL